VKLINRLLRRPELPEWVELEAEELVVALAEVVGGGQVVATSRALWLGAGERLRWHLIGKAKWEGGALVVVPVREVESVEGAVLIADEPPRRVRLAVPGGVPEAVHQRVTGSIRTRHHRELPAGGAWFVQRAVAGQNGVVLQVRADPGTDGEVVRQVAAEVARRLRGSALDA
jgi:hypothetical protein